MTRPAKARRGSGLATLPILLLLLMASLLAAAWAQRSVLNEIRSASLQFQHGVAFEAAEAGLGMDAGAAEFGPPTRRRLPRRRAPTAQPASSNRFLHFAADGASGDVDVDAARARRRVGHAGADVRAQCSMAGAVPVRPTPLRRSATQPAPRPAKRLRPSASGCSTAARRPRSRISVTGCSDAGRPCVGDAAERADASAAVRQTLALLPVIATPPAATLTARGNVSAPAAAALTVHNARRGLGRARGPCRRRDRCACLRSTSVAGAALSGERIGGDAALGRAVPGAAVPAPLRSADRPMEAAAGRATRVVQRQQPTCAHAAARAARCRGRCGAHCGRSATCAWPVRCEFGSAIASGGAGRRRRPAARRRGHHPRPGACAQSALVRCRPRRVGTLNGAAIVSAVVQHRRCTDAEPRRGADRAAAHPRRNLGPGPGELAR